MGRALDGLTPYAIEDLAFDWQGEGDSVRVAAVARQTLREARDFARQYGFDGRGYCAAPAAGLYPGEPVFVLEAAPRSRPQVDPAQAGVTASALLIEEEPAETQDALDLDGDGLKDLVMLYTAARPFYQGMFLQFLTQQADGSFVDTTADHIDPQVFNAPGSGGWGLWLHAVDLTGDGREDLVVEMKAPDQHRVLLRGEDIEADPAAAAARIAAWAGLAEAPDASVYAHTGRSADGHASYFPPGSWKRFAEGPLAPAFAQLAQSAQALGY